MRRLKLGTGLLAILFSASLLAAPPANPPDKKTDSDSEKADGHKFEPFKP